MRHARAPRPRHPTAALVAVAAAPAPPCCRARRAPQAPAGALVPAAHGHAAPRRARRVAAGARLRRRSSWPSSPRWGSRRRRATPRPSVVAAPGQGLRVASPSWSRRCCSPRPGSTATAPCAPGCRASSPSLFQVTVVVALYAIVSGQDFSSYYIFYGSLFFAVAYVVDVPLRLRAHHGAAAARGGLPAPRGARGHRRAHRGRGARAGAGGGDAINVIGFVSLQPRPDNGLISLGTLDDIGDIVLAHRVDEVIIADPEFPEREAVELVDQCHQRGVVVRIAPSTMEILVHRAEFVPGQSVPLFELKPPVFEGFDYALKRSFDLVGVAAHHGAHQPAAAGLRARDQAHLARPGHLPLDAARDRRRAVRVLQVPHDVPRRRRPPAGAGGAQRGLGRAVQDPRRPARDAGRAPAAALLDRRAAPALQRHPRRDVARRPAAAAPARLRPPRGLAQEALPRPARHHRAVAGLGPLGPRLRRPRAPRLPLPRALVGVPGPLDPGQDRPAVLSRRGAF